MQEGPQILKKAIVTGGPVQAVQRVIQLLKATVTNGGHMHRRTVNIGIPKGIYSFSSIPMGIPENGGRELAGFGL